MSKYSTIIASNGFAVGTIIKNDSGKYFGGYDFMGSINWKDGTYDAVLMDDDEAEQIIKDLEASDEPAEPEPMNRIEILRALAAAKNAFHDELAKRGIYITTWNQGENVRKLFVSNDSKEFPVTYIGEFTFNQTVYKNGLY